jgi:hypothetical protein
MRLAGIVGRFARVYTDAAVRLTAARVIQRSSALMASK